MNGAANSMDLYDFLVDAELQHYYNSIKSELKVTLVQHLKYATDEDLRQIGMSKPEIRRLRKHYDKHHPNGYLSKIKRLLHTPHATASRRHDDGHSATAAPGASGDATGAGGPNGASTSPGKLSTNKHIIPADSICVNKQLGTGEFGIVQQGVWTNGTERIQVAIKCLCRERMQTNPMEFLKEAAIMHAIEHANIVRLYGVVLDTDSLMLVTELAHLRSLLECLKDSQLRVSFLTVPTLCDFAAQICAGMQYLESKRLIHRDLAARNILVFNKNKVKISDFGLSRALGVGKDYYQTNFNVNLKLPIAWCAPECINFLRFTNASDVWAYGVCLWEMFSYGFQPWAALTGHQILEAIDEPNYQRLEAPDCCPREYYNLMQRCWQHEPARRPKFTEIGELLADVRPEQVKAIQAYAAAANGAEAAAALPSGGDGDSKAKRPNAQFLNYRQNEIISVLDKLAAAPYWKGVLNSGKTGLFDPSNTVTHLATVLPSAASSTASGPLGVGASMGDSMGSLAVGVGAAAALMPRGADGIGFARTLDRTSKRSKLRTEMISQPQNDLKHTGHVGLDGAYFGDVAFMSTSTTPQTYNQLPRQIVTPYKPSEDIEQMPLLLPPTPTSPVSLQQAGAMFMQAHQGDEAKPVDASTFVQLGQNGGPSTAFNFPNAATSSNPFVLAAAQKSRTGRDGVDAVGNLQLSLNTTTASATNPMHEYHEISDDDTPTVEKVSIIGSSLLDEMDMMFNSLKASDSSTTTAPTTNGHHHEPQSPNGFGNASHSAASAADAENRKNHHFDAATMRPSGSHRSHVAPGSGAVTLHRPPGHKFLGGSKRGNGAAGGGNAVGTVKPISIKDERILNQAIDYVNEISARSMTDLAAGGAEAACQSPKRKFSFRFPHVKSGGGGGIGGGGATNAATSVERDEAGNGGASSSMGSSAAGGSDGATSSSSTAPRTRNFSDELNKATDLQSSITEKCREAYNILVEKSATPERHHHHQHSQFEFTKPTATLPRSSCVASQSANSCSSGSNTLATSTTRQRRPPACLDLSGVHATTAASPSKFYHAHSSSMPAYTNSYSPCESPSYILHAGASNDIPPQRPPASEDAASANPVPLPPRDRNKIMQANAKRHVRKYPLIVPIVHEAQSPQHSQRAAAATVHLTTPTKLAPPPPLSATPSFGLYQNTTEMRHMHHQHNLHQHQQQPMVDCTDSASLHFENALEHPHAGCAQLLSPDANMAANDFTFDIDKQDDFARQKAAATSTSAAPVHAQDADLYRNLDTAVYGNMEVVGAGSLDAVDCAAVDVVDVGTAAGAGEPQPETTATAAAAAASESAVGALQLQCNSVSCEDLLEFSDQKPKGRERGVESDEVRIMTKVLGATAAFPETFIEALDFIDWDVHKAIKLIKLRSTTQTGGGDGGGLSLQQCVDALQANEWDMQLTICKLNTTKL